MSNIIDKILNFHNIQIDASIINGDQIKCLITNLVKVIDSKVQGDVVEFGCYVGESSKYLRKTLDELNSSKNLYVYDSFEGLPALSKFEENTGWTAGGLKTSQEILLANFNQNNLTPPIIHKGWFKDVPEDKIPEKISFAFLDGDFYDSIYDSLHKVIDRVEEGGCICFHDFDRPDLPGVRVAAEKVLLEKGLSTDISVPCEQVGVYFKKTQQDTLEVLEEKIEKEPISSKESQTTIVTGIWDLSRDKAGDGFQRSFDHYIDNFNKLLECDNPMVIFIEKQYENIVWAKRKKDNTFVINKEISDFRSEGFPFYQEVQSIRSNESWLSQVGWLPNSTQASMELYNPMVMSKMFMLHDAKIFNPFDTDYFIWIDGGICNTIHSGYFTHDKVINKIHDYIDKFLFVSFPYIDGPEIHGFSREGMAKYCGEDPQYVCRAGIFGGHKDYISEANSLYYHLLSETLSSGYMGTEESLFTIMAYQKPEVYSRFELENEQNGLLTHFFEHIKNFTTQSLNKNTGKPKNTIQPKFTNNKSLTNNALYILTYNSPEQLSTLIKSFKQVPNFLDSFSEKYIIDNSLKQSVFADNLQIALDNSFSLIKKDNIGICGGRQFVAEHFDTTQCEYMLFFEDDMFLNPPSEQGLCRNGFRKYVENIVLKSRSIMKKNQLDFLKWTFSEFFGDNKTQWSWYNVPQAFRESHWPDYHKLPQFGLDPNAPLVEYKSINVEEDLAYALGECYYCNWPVMVSKSGSKKMFLDTTWAHPYEQTWMSHIFQETVNGNIKSGILLASPITHDRFIHYPQEERIES